MIIPVYIGANKRSAEGTKDLSPFQGVISNFVPANFRKVKPSVFRKVKPTTGNLQKK
jgi:hypothetical protein